MAVGVKSINANCVIWDVFGDQEYHHMNALVKENKQNLKTQLPTRMFIQTSLFVNYDKIIIIPAEHMHRSPYIIINPFQESTTISTLDLAL